MATIQISVPLSAPAARAWRSLCHHTEFDQIAELFFDKLQYERYRDFAVLPEFFTNHRGERIARRQSQHPKGEKLQQVKLRVGLPTFRRMQKLQRRGLTLAWQVEEILFYGFRTGLLAVA